MAFIHNVDLSAFRTAENKECVIQHIHLQNRFVHFHRFYREAFGLDDPVLLGLVHLLHKFRCEGSGFHPFFQLALIFYDLAEQGINDGFQSILTLVRGPLCPEEKSLRFNGDLDGLMVTRMDDGDLRLRVAAEELVKLGELLFCPRAERVLDACVSGCDVNLHCFNPFCDSIQNI